MHYKFHISHTQHITYDITKKTSQAPCILSENLLLRNLIYDTAILEVVIKCFKN